VDHSNLGPGNYPFDLVAANNDGVWNDVGTSLTIAVAPAFYQTWWFELMCFAIVAMLLLMVYRMRLHHVERRLRERLEVQHVERERIAREIHDTLLQGVQGLVMRIQAVAFQVPDDQHARRNALRFRLRDDGVGMSEQMLASGRPTHWGLRGMRERADGISAQLHMWSREGEGCEIELTVPAAIAFLARKPAWQGWLAGLHIRSSRQSHGDGLPTSGKRAKSQYPGKIKTP
jgi:signal transduction histidine kinase